MILFKPLEEVLVDLERACNERNYKIFNSECQRYENIIGELSTDLYQRFLTPDSIKNIQEYYKTRLRFLKQRLE